MLCKFEPGGLHLGFSKKLLIMWSKILALISYLIFNVLQIQCLSLFVLYCVVKFFVNENLNFELSRNVTNASYSPKPTNSIIVKIIIYIAYIRLYER